MRRHWRMLSAPSLCLLPHLHQSLLLLCLALFIITLHLIMLIIIVIFVIVVIVMMIRNIIVVFITFIGSTRLMNSLSEVKETPGLDQ